MSDLFKARQKVEEGASWRGTIHVIVGERGDQEGERQQLSVRQLFDPEFWEVMSLVDTDEIDELQDQLPEDKMEQLNELRNSDEDLTEEQEEEMRTLRKQINDEGVNMFDILSTDTFEGIKQAAHYGVEPDQEDIQYILTEHGGEIREKYGRADEDSATDWAQKNVIDPMINRSVDFTSFSVGIKVLTETLGDTGNSES